MQAMTLMGEQSAVILFLGEVPYPAKPTKIVTAISTNAIPTSTLTPSATIQSSPSMGISPLGKPRPDYHRPHRDQPNRPDEDE